jgi:hypothetical protein
MAENIFDEVHIRVLTSRKRFKIIDKKYSDKKISALLDIPYHLPNPLK